MIIIDLVLFRTELWFEFGNIQTPWTALVRGIPCHLTCFSYVQGVSLPLSWTSRWLVMHLPSPISFFVNESILFLRVVLTEINKVVDIIRPYKSTSGQRINIDKYELTTSGNVSEGMISIGQQLGAKIVAQYSKFMGLPTIISRRKKLVFQSLVDRVINKLKKNL